jgi:hypothetical protein
MTGVYHHAQLLAEIGDLPNFLLQLAWKSNPTQPPKLLGLQA